MDTPKSRPASKPPSHPQSPGQRSNNAGSMDPTNKQPPVENQESIPLNSPLRTHPKRLLPSSLSSTYPHGHLSGHPRSPETQARFDARRREILASMTAPQIEKAYEDVAAKVREELEEAERKTKEVEGEREKLRMEREMERRVWGKLRGLSGK